MRSRTAVRRRCRRTAAIGDGNGPAFPLVNPGIVGLAGLEPAPSSLSGFCPAACSPRKRPATWATDAPPETAGDRCEPLGSDGMWTKRGPRLARRQGGPVLPGRGRLRRSGPPRPGTDRPAGTARPIKALTPCMPSRDIAAKPAVTTGGSTVSHRGRSAGRGREDLPSPLPDASPSLPIDHGRYGVGLLLLCCSLQRDPLERDRRRNGPDGDREPSMRQGWPDCSSAKRGITTQPAKQRDRAGPARRVAQHDPDHSPRWHGVEAGAAGRI